MENQITIASKTQMLVIEPNTQSVSIVDAGPMGPIDPLAAGAPGTNAKSAYEIAQDHGFVGTEAQWVASLHPAAVPVTAPDIIGGILVTELSASTEVLGGIDVTTL